MNAGERREGDKRQKKRRKVISGVKVVRSKRMLASESCTPVRTPRQHGKVEGYREFFNHEILWWSAF